MLGTSQLLMVQAAKHFPVNSSLASHNPLLVHCFTLTLEVSEITVSGVEEREERWQVGEKEKEAVVFPSCLQLNCNRLLLWLSFLRGDVCF